jgi:hypothetical protein
MAEGGLRVEGWQRQRGGWSRSQVLSIKDTRHESGTISCFSN